MSYGHRPLYPPAEEPCRMDNCVRMPLFGCETWNPHGECGRCSQTVRLENPCCPGEYAEVMLSVDSCGNLVLCVHRGPSCGYHGKHRR